MSANPAPKKRRRKEVNPLPWVLLAITLVVGAIWFVSRGSKPHAKAKAEAEALATSGLAQRSAQQWEQPAWPQPP